MGKHREFDATTMEIDGRRVHAVKVSCGKCGKVYKVSMNRIRGHDAGTDIEESRIASRKFEQAGWYVGRRGVDDRCPEHKATATAIAEQLKNKDILVPPKSVPEPLQTRAEAPPTMGREEKRLIFSKLHEVYLDETRGYADNWTDKKVAEDLGVPRAWVETVREADFGPVKSNDEIERHLKAVTDAISEAKALMIEAGAIKSAAELAIGRANAAVAKVATLSPLIHTLEGHLRTVQGQLR